MAHTPDASAQDTCRTVDIDGTPIRIRGTGDMTPEDRAALADVIAAAKRKYAAGPTPGGPVDSERRDRYAAAMYATLERSRDLHPWETMSPLRRKVWYDRADAAMAVADAQQADLRAELERRTLMLQASRDVAADLRARVAELEQQAAGVRADTLSGSERQFLSYALDLASDQMASRGDEFDADDDAAMAKLRRMADEGSS